VKVRSEGVKAVVVDRADLDAKMAAAAMDAGAGFSYGDRYISHSASSGGIEVRSASGGAACRSLIGADGHSSAVAASLGNNGPKEYIRGIQADVCADADFEDIFRIRIGNGVAPGFFSWEIPCGDFVRVGLCTSWSAGPPWAYLKKLLSEHYRGEKIRGMYCGKIPLGGRRTTYGDRCLLIGDAACHVKPVSGGGLYPSLRAAPILAEVLSSALESGDLSAKALSRYERMWMADFGKELRRAYFLRGRYARLDDARLDRAGEYCSRDDVRPALDAIDLDHPAEVIRGMLRRPSAVPGLISLAARCLI
jgi:flavin-dependent dehydrogenase